MTANPEKTTTTDHGPDVFTFPPVIYLAFFVIGYLTDRGFPMDIGAPLLRSVAGWMLVGLGIALAAWAIARFVRAKTHIDVRKPALTLVTDGPYRITRNPMYLAAALLYAGIAVAFSKPILLASLIPCLLTVEFLIIRREEAYLASVFGDAYRDFQRRVRRWILTRPYS